MSYTVYDELTHGQLNWYKGQEMFKKYFWAIPIDSWNMSKESRTKITFKNQVSIKFNSGYWYISTQFGNFERTYIQTTKIVIDEDSGLFIVNDYIAVRYKP